MPRSAAVFLIFLALGCSREIGEHTHPLVEHEHAHSHEHTHELVQHTHEHQHPFADHTHAGDTADAAIVSIDPPLPERTLDHSGNGVLRPLGPHTITVTFSERPRGLTVTNVDERDCNCTVWPVFEWTLEQRTLELKAISRNEGGAVMVEIKWNSGFKTLGYLCRN